MSNYTKATDFSAKDALTSGDPNKVVSGTEIDAEFDAIQTSNNTKANKKVPATTSNMATLDAAGDLADSGFLFSGTGGEVTSTAAELNKLDGATVTTTELNQLAGTTNIKEFVSLAEPEVIAASTLTSGAWTTVNNSTLGTAGATAAVIRCLIWAGKNSVTDIYGYLSVRKKGETTVASASYAAIAHNVVGTSSNLWAKDTNDVVIELDSNSDFEYYYDTTASLTTDSSAIWLLGYYI